MLSHVGLCRLAEACLQVCYCLVWCDLHAHATDAEFALSHLRCSPIVQSKDLCFLPLALSCKPVAILQFHSQSKQQSDVQICKAEALDSCLTVLAPAFGHQCFDASQGLLTLTVHGSAQAWVRLGSSSPTPDS